MQFCVQLAALFDHLDGGWASDFFVRQVPLSSWCIPVILALRGWRQEDQESKASLEPHKTLSLTTVSFFFFNAYKICGQNFYPFGPHEPRVSQCALATAHRYLPESCRSDHPSSILKGPFLSRTAAATTHLPFLVEISTNYHWNLVFIFKVGLLPHTFWCLPPRGQTFAGKPISEPGL